MSRLVVCRLGLSRLGLSRLATALSGARPDEVAVRRPCDAVVPAPRARWVRAVDAGAPPAAVWRWVCQLTVAPYSYDLVDNLGRTSPRTFTPGADRLEVGQRLMILFVIDSFVVGEHLTVRLRRPGRGILGEFAITYSVVPGGGPGGRGTRLVGTVAVDGSPSRLGRLVRWALGWGDLVMMRRQLRTLARYARG